MTDEKALAFVMEFIGEGIELCQDLEARVVKNWTSTAFITCDDPVLRYNRLLEKHHVAGGITGTAHAGLQFFLPIDAQTLVIIYDSKYYKIGDRRNKGVITCSEQDVHNINLLSVLNCERTVFFNEKISQAYLNQLAQRAAKFPAPNQTVATKLYRVGQKGNEIVYSAEEPGDYQSYILHTYATSLKTKLNLSFLHFTREGSRFIADSQPANMRPHCAIIHRRNNDPRERASVKLTYDD